MNRIYLLIIFVLFCNAAPAQVPLNGSNGGGNIRSLDSTVTAAEALGITQLTMAGSQLIVLSASDTDLKTLADTTLHENKYCVISFIGCDEEHYFILDFMHFYYAEYIKEKNSEAAFFKAKTYLLNKYPESPVTPIMTCGK